MKRYIFYFTCLVSVFFAKNVIAQYKAPTAAQIRQFSHDIGADNKDSWWHAGGGDEAGDTTPPKFMVWVKLHPIDRIHGFLSISNNGGIVLGQLYNTEKLELATTSVTPQNAAKYQYRVLVNDSIVLTPWSTPSIFKSNKFTSYAYLGEYECRQKTLKLEIAEKSNLLKRMVYAYNSDDLQPVQIDMIFKQYQKGGLTGVSGSEARKGFIIDPVSEMEQININIAAIHKLEMYHLYLKREFDSYVMQWPIGNNWEHSFSAGASIPVNSSYFSKPGKYTIIIRPEISIGHNKSIIVGQESKAFFIVPRGPVTFPVKTVALIILIILTTGGFMFMMYRDQQKRKLAREARNKQIATLQLQAVRSQLNPHFIFNALAGIQNLMNKNEVENANKYLSRFARLTRNVLDDGNKELTTIDREVSLLNDYLQMEQMRFGFQFSINIDVHEIDQQIEIPAMLLQPFAENAVKHGVSALKDKGLIKVDIQKRANNLILTVQDNGKGFGAGDGSGMGIKLCEERIKLLNSIYKNTKIVMQKTSGNSGTLIIIELQNWV